MMTPTPNQVAEQLETLARRLRSHGAHVERVVGTYAARGFPAGGTTRGRSTAGVPESEQVGLTSTEAAAAHPHEFVGKDTEWARLLRKMHSLAVDGVLLVDGICAHADPASSERAVRRPGSGTCAACGRDVPGTESDRLRSGWCKACEMAWVRAERPDRAAFERNRWADKNPPTSMHVDPTEVGALA